MRNCKVMLNIITIGSGGLSLSHTTGLSVAGGGSGFVHQVLYPAEVESEVRVDFMLDNNYKYYYNVTINGEQLIVSQPGGDGLITGW